MAEIKMISAMLMVLALLSSTYAAEWIKGGYVRPDENDTAAFYRESPNDVLKRDFDASAAALIP